MLPNRVLVADVGAGHVACGSFAAGPGGKLILQQLAVEVRESNPAEEANWTAQTGDALAAIARRTKLAGPVAIAVPGHLALTKFIKTPAVEKSKRGKIIQFEASQNIPYPLEEVVWDHAVVADDGMDLEVMLTAAKADAMQALCEAADAAGFPVVRAAPSCLALAHAFRFNHPAVTDPVLLVNIGARSTHLLFLEPGRFHVRTLTLAGNAVTQAVAEELRIEFAPAEALKVQVLSGRSDLPAGSPARAAVQKAADNFCARLQLEIVRSTVNLRRQAAAAQPTAVYLAGGGSAIPALTTVLGEKLKIPAERYNALQRVEIAPAAAAAAAAAGPVLADLVGLATHLVAKDEAHASLLPAALGVALAFRRRQPVLLATAALAAAALLPPIWFYHAKATRAQAQVAQIDAQLRPVRSIQNRNAGHLEQIEQAKQQVAALHGLAETKSNWIEFFTDLQSRLVAVEDVWLERLAVMREPAAAQPAAGAADAPPALHLALSGRLLDKNNPVSKVSADSYERVKRLLVSFGGSQFIAAVENERFDNSQPGILRFDFMLVINPQKPL